MEQVEQRHSDVSDPRNVGDRILGTEALVTWVHPGWLDGIEYIRDLGFLEVFEDGGVRLRKWTTTLGHSDPNPQPGDIVGYAYRRRPYSPISWEFNSREGLRYPPYFRNFGIVDSDGQVIATGKDGKTYEFELRHPEIMTPGEYAAPGELNEVEVHIFRHFPEPVKKPRTRKKAQDPASA